MANKKEGMSKEDVYKHLEGLKTNALKETYLNSILKKEKLLSPKTRDSVYSALVDIYERGKNFGAAAELVEKSGDTKRAIDLYEKGKRFNKAAELAEKSGDTKRAIDLYEKAGKRMKANIMKLKKKLTKKKK